MTFNRVVGNTTLPTTNTGAETLAYLDPAQDILIALLKAAINNDLGPAWNQARLSTVLADRSPVETTVPFEPELEFMQQAKVKFPILAVYPSGESEGSQFSMQIDQMMQQWHVDYILGPLSVEDRRSLVQALRAVQKIVHEIVKVGGHPVYAMDVNSVQPNQVIVGEGSGTCGFKSMRWVTASPPGSAAFAEGAPPYWATRIVLETTELGEIDDAAVGVAHVGGRFFFGTGTGVDDDASDDDNGIIEEQIESITAV